MTTDTDKARAVGRKALGIYLNLQNYLNNWKRLGFTDADVTAPGSDALVDAVVAYGTAEQIAARLHDHLAAGADHVAVQVLTRPESWCPRWPNSPARWGSPPTDDGQTASPAEPARRADTARCKDARPTRGKVLPCVCW